MVTTNAVLLFTCQLPAGITAKATIADMEPETFELMLGWMYGTIDVVLPLDQAVDVYVASDRLGMTALHDACAHIIAQTLPGIPSSCCIENVVGLWHFATVIQSEVVIKVSTASHHLYRLACTSCAKHAMGWMVFKHYKHYTCCSMGGNYVNKCNPWLVIGAAASSWECICD